MPPGVRSSGTPGGPSAAKTVPRNVPRASLHSDEIPRAERKLVTAHNAFGYFCKEYGFEAISVLGMSRSEDSSMKKNNESVQTIRENGIKAAFPEDQANPKILAEIVRSTGIKLGDPLVADGTAKHAHTFEMMLAHNVRAIVAALAAR